MTRKKKLLLLAACTVGSAASSQATITWSWNGAPPADPYKTNITNIMNGACNDFNSMINLTDNILVDYNSGVPTDQTDGYLGVIEFGTQFSQRAASHEMSHHLGTGTYYTWSNFSGSGIWSGTWGTALEHAFDGANAQLNCDTQHYWPYGLNQDSEFNFSTEFRHSLMCGALRQDMGLVNGAANSPIPNGTYKIINKYSGLALGAQGAGTAPGTLTDQYGYYGATGQQWTFTQEPGNQYQIVNVLNGLALDNYQFAGEGQNGAEVDTWTVLGNAAQRWWIQPTSTGAPYFKIINVYSGMVLDIQGPSTANGAIVYQYSDSQSNGSQEWTMVPVVAPTVPAVTVKALTSQPFVYQVITTSGPSTYTATGLPSGVSIDKNSGKLSGTLASTAATTKITVKATNAVGSASGTITLQAVAPTLPVANGTYKIINRASGLALGAANGSTSPGTATNQYPYQGAAGAQWTLTQVSGNQYQIACVSDGLVLDDYNFAPPGTDNSILDTYTSNGQSIQRWWLEPSPSGKGNYYLVNVYSGMTIDAQNSTIIQNAPVVLNTERFIADSQEWSFQAP